MTQTKQKRRQQREWNRENGEETVALPPPTATANDEKVNGPFFPLSNFATVTFRLDFIYSRRSQDKLCICGGGDTSMGQVHLTPPTHLHRLVFWPQVNPAHAPLFAIPIRP